MKTLGIEAQIATRGSRIRDAAYVASIGVEVDGWTLRDHSQQVRMIEASSDRRAGLQE